MVFFIQGYKGTGIITTLQWNGKLTFTAILPVGKLSRRTKWSPEAHLTRAKKDSCEKCQLSMAQTQKYTFMRTYPQHRPLIRKGTVFSNNSVRLSRLQSGLDLGCRGTCANITESYRSWVTSEVLIKCDTFHTPFPVTAKPCSDQPERVAGFTEPPSSGETGEGAITACTVAIWLMVKSTSRLMCKHTITALYL